MGTVIGIDLGTTNSVAAFFEGGNPRIILTPEGDRLLPSMVAFNQYGDRLVGNPARSQLITNTDTIYSVKRLMGKRFSEVKPYLYQFYYEIVEGKEDTLKIKIDDSYFSPEEISAMIIEKLKDAAEVHMHDEVTEAVITVPAYFNDSQRQATKDAGEIAGLEVLRIINEPTAASLAFSLDLNRKANVVVYDFGGGTIDISVLEVQNEVIKVLATAGDINIGGNDFDILVSNLVVEEIKEKYGVDLSQDKLALQRIRDAAESAKKELSAVEECEINLPFIADSDQGAVHCLKYLSRNDLEEVIREKVEKTLEICKRALKSAGMTTKDIDEVILVGGSTRIPFVQRKVKGFFNKEPNKKVNPDEIVAMGAAMQAAITKGETKDILLLDVTPLSLGVKTFGGAFTRVIEANTTIPTNQSLVFSTVEDNQEEVEIMVYQGERAIAEENKLLGRFILPDIKPAGKGVPRVEVSYSININGILKVSAIDLSSRSEKEVLITYSGLLSDEEITEIKRNAEKYRESDLKKKELVQVKNKIVNYVYSIKKLLENSQFPSQLVSQSRRLFKKANAEMEKESPQAMDKIQTELAELEIRLSKYNSDEEDMDVVLDIDMEMDTETEMEMDEDEDEDMDGETEMILASDMMKTVEEEILEREKAPEPVDEEAREENLINQEALKIKKEILNFVYSIEQYINHVKLDGELLSRARDLVANAHTEIGKDKPQGLGKIHKDLSALSTRIDNMVGQTLGISEEEKPAARGEEEDERKDDTKPFRIIKG